MTTTAGDSNDSAADLMRENIRYAKRLANQRELLHQELADNLKLLDELAETRYQFNRSLNEELPALAAQTEQATSDVDRLRSVANHLKVFMTHNTR
jgi:putative hemolysin